MNENTIFIIQVVDLPEVNDVYVLCHSLGVRD